MNLAQAGLRGVEVRIQSLDNFRPSSCPGKKITSCIKSALDPTTSKIQCDHKGSCKRRKRKVILGISPIWKDSSPQEQPHPTSTMRVTPGLFIEYLNGTTNGGSVIQYQILGQEFSSDTQLRRAHLPSWLSKDTRLNTQISRSSQDIHFKPKVPWRHQSFETHTWRWQT